MASEQPASWSALFEGGTPGSAAVLLRLRVVRKQQRAWMVLPRRRVAAARAMTLYPAQRPVPRLARLALKSWLQLGLPWPAKPFQVRKDAPFVRFLCEVAGRPVLPEFALLSGNPTAPGRRFVLLVFSDAGRPVTVVKAGVGVVAGRLIAHEADFLTRVAPRLSGVPRLSHRVTVGALAAFATDYFPGDSPPEATPEQLLTTLAGWMDASCTRPLSGLPQWTRLAAEESVRDELHGLTESVGQRQVHPVVAHGDFVPWNIKVDREGRWTVLDWDRGEQFGVPAWDWFHFVIQTGLLVDRLAVGPLCDRVRSLIGSASFQTYAARAGIRGMEGALLHAYLLHAVAVFNPTTGPSLPEAMRRTLFPGGKPVPDLAACGPAP